MDGTGAGRFKGQRFDAALEIQFTDGVKQALLVERQVLQQVVPEWGR